MCRHCTRFAQQLTGIRKIAQGFMVDSGIWPVPADFEERAPGRLTGEGQAFSRSRSGWAMSRVFLATGVKRAAK
jgi:hypothetical protein